MRELKPIITCFTVALGMKNAQASGGKKLEEKQIEEEQAAKAQNSKIPICSDDDDDYSAITLEEPVNSLSIGDEHLDTIPATESDELIKSSVEDLIPIPSEFEGIPDTMCDVHLVNNPTTLEAKDHFKIVINSIDDISSSDDDSLYKENIESKMGEVNVNTLMMEQYLALTHGNQVPGVVKPEIKGNVNFEIKSQFMRELREDIFFRNKNNDPHEHVEQISDIVSLFNIPGVTHDAVMLHVFLITLTGPVKRTCEGSCLDKNCPVHEEVKSLEKVKYGEFGGLEATGLDIV
nr:hypothetical protein [Tanacetum cinerariifolium]